MPLPYEDGPCAPWADVADFECLDDASDEVKAAALESAQWVLFHLSGDRYTGICERTVRPEACPCTCDSHAFAAWRPGDPALFSVNGGVSCCGTRRGVTLGYEPVIEVSEVLVDGAVVSEGEYRVDEHVWLVRNDGTSWPCCQDRGLAASEQGTFQVTFTAGQAPPAMGVVALQALACQFAVAMTPGAAGCQLPKRVQNVIRQGVSVTMFDPFDFLDNGRVGLYECDLFLSVANPGGLTGDAVIMMADDIPPVTRQTWP